MTPLPITQITLQPGFVDLGMGNPDLDLLPLALIRQSAQAYFAAGDRRPLQYGKEQGDGYFRRALAQFLSTAYGKPVDRENLFVTNGASSALALLCSLYTQPGDVVFVEEPTYFLALRIFADYRLDVVPVPMDDDGLRLDALDRLLETYQPKFVYTIPTFQNPTGRTLIPSRREGLVERAQHHDFLIIADEVYHFLPYTQQAPEPFALLAPQAEQVVSVNSFSKILAPGLRLGWIQAHDRVIKRLARSGLLDSGGGMNPFVSALLRTLIESDGLSAHIARLRDEYAHRLDAMDAALQQYLPRAEYVRPQGGFFFWVRFPGVDGASLRQKGRDFDVGLRQGTLFSSGDGMEDTVRLSFSYYGPDQIEEGVKRLSRCLETMRS
jgi:DNA-binding transcriptional MocR family regulator